MSVTAAMPSWWTLSAAILVAIFYFSLPSVQADIRCYCNFPVCVTTGYMCKATLNSCFSEHFSYSSDLSQSRHGCLDMLNDHRRALCQGSTGSPHLLAASGFPILLCCGEDMCNYININIQVHTKSNTSHLSGVYGYGEDRQYFGGGHEAALQQDLWFKAAVIAVPIAGGFILILLIFLAARLLRQDNQRQRHLLELRRQRQYKTHLLIGDPRHAPVEKACSKSKHCGVYKNFNLSLSRDSCCGDSVGQFIYDKSLTGSLCSALFPWTKWDTHKSITIV